MDACGCLVIRGQKDGKRERKKPAYIFTGKERGSATTDVLVVSKSSPTDVLVVSKTMCAPTQGTRFRASARAGPLLDTSARTEAPQGSRMDPELLPQNRSRQEQQIGANPDGSGMGKIPGFGGRQNLCTFQYKSYSKLEDFGSEQAPGSF